MKYIALRWRFRMYRVLVRLTMLLLTMNVTAAASAAHATSGPVGIIVHGPTFHYTLKEDRNPSVCKHMLHVFNHKFAHPWDAPMLTSRTNDPNYSASSKYAFPLLPGVKHSTKATFEMRFSAWPTSPEFSAIHWREGRARFGGCPINKICAAESLMPILVAHFDFDNDGSIDTVIWWAFDSGEQSPEDILNVWRGRDLKFTDTPSLWTLDHPKDKTLTPIMIRGEYLRPFIYRGVAYVATYKPDFANLSAASSETPLPIIREDMLINRYYFAGRKDRIGRPEWSSDTVCDLQMKRLKN